jgi:hypothetical protein
MTSLPERTAKKTLVASIVALLSNGYKQRFHCWLLTYSLLVTICFQHFFDVYRSLTGNWFLLPTWMLSTFTNAPSRFCWQHVLPTMLRRCKWGLRRSDLQSRYTYVQNRLRVNRPEFKNASSSFHSVFSFLWRIRLRARFGGGGEVRCQIGARYNFLYSTASRPTLGPMQPPNKNETGGSLTRNRKAEAWSWPLIST